MNLSLKLKLLTLRCQDYPCPTKKHITKAGRLVENTRICNGHFAVAVTKCNDIARAGRTLAAVLVNLLAMLMTGFRTDAAW